MFEDNLQQGIFLDFVDIFWRDYCSLFFPSRLFFFLFPSPPPHPPSPFSLGLWRGCCGFSTSDSDSQDRRRSAPLAFVLEREREKKRREVTAYRENNIYLEAFCAHVSVYSCARDFLFYFLLFCHPRTTLILTNHLPNFNRGAGLVCYYNIYVT